MALYDDFLSADATAHPHSYFAELRREAPIFWSDRYRAWILTRYATVSDALRNAHLSSARLAPRGSDAGNVGSIGARSVYQMLSRWMTFNDPPSHTRLRKAVQRAFTATAVESLKRGTQQAVDE